MGFWWFSNVSLMCFGGFGGFVEFEWLEAGIALCLGK